MSFFGEEKPAAAPAPVREQFSRRIEVEPRKRQRGTEEAVHSFTMRVRVEASNRFVDWCERERISYPLVNDSGLVLARELCLPTFEAAGMDGANRPRRGS